MSEAASKRVLITGATGMVGGQALDYALGRPEVGAVTVVGRRSVGREHPKLRELLHADFSDCAALADVLREQDAVLYCIGVYTGAVPDELFRAITVDHTLAFAGVLAEVNRSASFCLLSGAGSDPSGRSRMAFARYKGEAEAGLIALGLGRFHSFRPGYIYPSEPREEPGLSYRITRRIYPVLRHLAPGSVITDRRLAEAMVEVGLHGAGSHASPFLENRDILGLSPPGLPA